MIITAVHYVLFLIITLSLYTIIYHWVVQARHKNISFRFPRLKTEPLTRVISESPFSRLAIFNPSLEPEFHNDRVRFIFRYTPGHQVGAAFNYISSYPYQEIEGFNNEFKGVRFQVRAVTGFMNRKLETTDYEYIYFPVNYYEWQEETVLWLQGEDIKFVNGNSSRVISVLPGKNNTTRLALMNLARDPITSKLCLLPVKILSPPRQRHKNWIGLNDNTFIKSISPKWSVNDEEFDVNIHRHLDLRISNGGKAAYNNNLHLGGCICRFTDKSYLIAAHSYRPYRTVFIEISDSYPHLPIRFGPLVQLTNDDETYIENVTSLTRMDDNHILVGMGLEDSCCKFVVIKITLLDAYLRNRGTYDSWMVSSGRITHENQLMD